MIFALFMTLAAFVVAAILLVIGFKKLKEWKAMRDTPTIKVVDIIPGRVEVKGKISEIPGRLLKGPISGKSCINYEVTVEEYQSRRNGARWTTIFREKKEYPFLLKDDSGMVVVDPKGAKFGKIRSYFNRQGLFNDLDSRSRSFLESRNIKDKGLFGLMKRQLRIKESIVPANVDLYVLGDAVEKAMPGELMDNFLVNPFTIMKKKLMVLSYKSEGETSSGRLSAGVIFTVLGSISLLTGIIILMAILIA